jgi:hypothetical protein
VSGRAGEAGELRGWAAGGVVAGGHMEIDYRDGEKVGGSHVFFFFLRTGKRCM